MKLIVYFLLIILILLNKTIYKYFHITKLSHHLSKQQSYTNNKHHLSCCSWNNEIIDSLDSYTLFTCLYAQIHINITYHIVTILNKKSQKICIMLLRDSLFFTCSSCSLRLRLNILI
jgi:hypothetical protein